MCPPQKVEEIVQVLVAEAISQYYLIHPYVESPSGFHKMLRDMLEKEIRQEIGYASGFDKINQEAAAELINFGRTAAARIINFWIVR